MSVHIYRFNSNAEQRYFSTPDLRGLYDLIALNGNIVSHTPSGVAAFLARANKRYFIDPQTHAFQHATKHLKKRNKDEPSLYEFKPSIVKLANERLGRPFIRVIEENRPLNHEDFFKTNNQIDTDLVAEICENIIRFQRDFLYEEIDSEEKEFIGSDYDFTPTLYIAPYFYLTPMYYKKWLEINVACYKRTKEIVEDKPVFFNIVISKEVLFEYHTYIYDSISEVKPDGILLWIDDHIEEELIDNDIDLYIDFLRNIKGNSGSIYNTYGGYLSTLLSHSRIDLISGIGHSINYGEHRGIIPVGGGIPMARFYFPSIHSRLKFGDASGIAFNAGWLSSEDRYFEKVCECKQCRKLISKCGSAEEAFAAYGETFDVTSSRHGRTVRLEYPTRDARLIAAYHYLYNKYREFKELEEKDIGYFLERMRATFNEIIPYSDEMLIGHLDRWERAIDKISQ